ncbi:MAG: class I SAM-dependent methyltransferase [Deferrisomatales bacterium]|nr:class I SAM-dependent methyltransferase [Deferrisomatales bacterium]
MACPSPPTPSPPDPWLARCAPTAGPGPGRKILDLACGAGRNALWLARQGHRVVGVDESLERIHTAREGARQQSVEVEFIVWQVAAGSVPSGPWDGICVCHFLDRTLFPELERALAPGGWLVYKTHLAHSLRAPRSRPRNQSYLLRPGELLAAFPTLAPLDYREWAGDGLAWAGLLARRAATPRRPPPGSSPG